MLAVIPDVVLSRILIYTVIQFRKEPRSINAVTALTNMACASRRLATAIRHHRLLWFRVYQHLFPTWSCLTTIESAKLLSEGATNGVDWYKVVKHEVTTRQLWTKGRLEQCPPSPLQTLATEELGAENSHGRPPYLQTICGRDPASRHDDDGSTAFAQNELLLTGFHVLDSIDRLDPHCGIFACGAFLPSKESSVAVYTVLIWRVPGWRLLRRIVIPSHVLEPPAVAGDDGMDADAAATRFTMCASEMVEVNWQDGIIVATLTVRVPGQRRDELRGIAVYGFNTALEAALEDESVNQAVHLETVWIGGAMEYMGTQVLWRRCPTELDDLGRPVLKAETTVMSVDGAWNGHMVRFTHTARPMISGENQLHAFLGMTTIHEIIDYKHSRTPDGLQPSHQIVNLLRDTHFPHMVLATTWEGFVSLHDAACGIERVRYHIHSEHHIAWSVRITPAAIDFGLSGVEPCASSAQPDSVDMRMRQLSVRAVSLSDLSEGETGGTEIAIWPLVIGDGDMEAMRYRHLGIDMERLAALPLEGMLNDTQYPPTELQLTQGTVLLEGAPSGVDVSDTELAQSTPGLPNVWGESEVGLVTFPDKIPNNCITRFRISEATATYALHGSILFIINRREDLLVVDLDSEQIMRRIPLGLPSLPRSIMCVSDEVVIHGKDGLFRLKMVLDADCRPSASCADIVLVT